MRGSSKGPRQRPCSPLTCPRKPFCCATLVAILGRQGGGGATQYSAAHNSLRLLLLQVLIARVHSKAPCITLQQAAT